VHTEERLNLDSKEVLNRLYESLKLEKCRKEEHQPPRLQLHHLGMQHAMQVPLQAPAMLVSASQLQHQRLVAG
jgi:hypothetical protein